MSEVEDRRWRALEAGQDTFSASPGEPTLRGAGVRGMVAAIEVATQVKITHEMLTAMDPAVGDRETRLRAAFCAAGFEVVE